MRRREVRREARRGLTSSSFSGRPLSPPLGSWRSASHQPRLSASTSSSTASRIASAARHVNTAREREREGRCRRQPPPLIIRSDPSRKMTKARTALVLQNLNDGRPGLTSRPMALSSNCRPKRAIKVSTAPDPPDRLDPVEPVECAEQGERVDGDVEEPGVGLAPDVAGEPARRPRLEGQDV